MLASYLESIKYVGHMYPVAFVRLLIGWHYLSNVLSRVNTGYLEHAYISERLNLSVGNELASGIYFDLFKNLIQSHWLIMTYVLIFFEVLIGFSYILGFGVRIAGLLGMLLSLHIYFYFEFPMSPGNIYLCCIHFLFVSVGAGRCLGLDYYFFKSRRGLLW
jgi:thiosulfate dehydrogenase [quinone] large subunit